MYRYANPKRTCIRHEVEGIIIPVSLDNNDYIECMKSVDEGNEILDYAEPEKTWGIIRSERIRLLSECDWVVVKSQETGVGISTAWTEYRQALRDITTQSDPNNISWPEQPTE